MTFISVNSVAQDKMRELLTSVEQLLDADVLALFGPITFGVEGKTQRAIEAITDRRERLAVVLHTGGGIVEVAERMVTIIRHHYAEVVPRGIELED